MGFQQKGIVPDEQIVKALRQELATAQARIAELEADKARFDGARCGSCKHWGSGFPDSGPMRGCLLLDELNGGFLEEGSKPSADFGCTMYEHMTPSHDHHAARAAIAAAMKPANVETRDPAHCYCPGNQVDGPCDGWSDDRWCWSLKGQKPTD